MDNRVQSVTAAMLSLHMMTDLDTVSLVKHISERSQVTWTIAESAAQWL